MRELSVPEAYHHAAITRSANNGREHTSGGVIATKAGLEESTSHEKLLVATSTLHIPEPLSITKGRISSSHIVEF